MPSEKQIEAMMPEIPDDDSDFTPELARKIIAKYQEHIRSLAAPASRLHNTSGVSGVMREIDPRHFDILVEAMAEVKATSDGLSDQPIADIVQGCIDEIEALEPAELATYAEWEFNEVLRGAQEFNDALPERMRRNAKDWLQPTEPATDVEPVAWRYYRHDGTSFVTVDDYADWQRFYPSREPLYTRPFVILPSSEAEAIRDKALEEAAQALLNKSAEAQGWRGEKIHRDRIKLTVLSFYYGEASDLILSLKSGGKDGK